MDQSALADVGVVIVAYESHEVIASALDALPLASLGGCVVVDNSPSEDTAAVVSGRSGVTLVRSGSNLGYGRGCNLGAEQPAVAHLPYLLFLNPDAVIREPDLRLLLDHLRSHPRCALVGPSLWGPAGRLPSSGDIAGPLRLLRLSAPGLLQPLTRPWRHAASAVTTGPVGYVEGACFLVRAASWRDVGCFDPRFFLFFEEMDLARRLHERGLTTDLVPDARAEHLVAASRSRLDGGAQRFLYASAASYVEKWYGSRRARVWRGTSRAMLTARILLGSEGAALKVARDELGRPTSVAS